MKGLVKGDRRLKARRAWRGLARGGARAGAGGRGRARAGAGGRSAVRCVRRRDGERVHVSASCGTPRAGRGGAGSRETQERRRYSRAVVAAGEAGYELACVAGGNAAAAAVEVVVAVVALIWEGSVAAD